MRFLIPLLLVAACAAGPRDLPDGARAAEGMATLVGNFDFSGFGVDQRVVFQGPGNKLLYLDRQPGLFVVAVPPGEYEVDHIDVFRVGNEPVRFIAEANKAVYIGTWRAVLGPDLEIRDESDAAFPEFERRYGSLAITRAFRQSRRIQLDLDPSLRWQDAVTCR